MDKVLWLVIDDFYKKNFKSMNISEIVKEFQNATDRKIQEFGFQNPEDFDNNLVKISEFIIQRIELGGKVTYIHDQSKK